MNTYMSRAECSLRRYKARYKIREFLDARDLSMREIATYLCGKSLGVLVYLGKLCQPQFLVGCTVLGCLKLYALPGCQRNTFLIRIRHGMNLRSRGKGHGNGTQRSIYYSRNCIHLVSYTAGCRLEGKGRRLAIPTPYWSGWWQGMAGGLHARGNPPCHPGSRGKERCG